MGQLLSGEEMDTLRSAPIDRAQLLEDLFHACDDDGSGALSLDEFAQLFDKVDETTREMFKEVDHHATDSKLTMAEFVTYHMQKFSALNDETFEMIVKSLTVKADEAEVIDDVAAVVKE